MARLAEIRQRTMEIPLTAELTIISDDEGACLCHFKASVLDPQGQTIQNALRKIGFADVSGVRQGKYFALSLADGLIRDAARPRWSALPARFSPTR